MRSKSAWLVALLTLLPAALSTSLTADEIRLERLFTTQSERLLIDAARSASLTSAATPELLSTQPSAGDPDNSATSASATSTPEFVIRYQGSAGFGGSPATVWINETRIDPALYPDVLRLNHKTRELELFLQAPQIWVSLKAGQALHLPRGLITDDMQNSMRAALPEPEGSLTEPSSQPPPASVTTPAFIPVLRSTPQ
jgi:hypothetical protein